MGKYKVKVDLNRKEVNHLLNCKPITNVLEELAQTIANTAGEGYEAGFVWYGKKRPNVTVRPVTKKAYKDNLENNTLVKSISGARKKTTP